MSSGTDEEMDRNRAATSRITARKAENRRAIDVAAIGFLAAAESIYCLAVTLRGIMPGMMSADRGEWASLPGGGLGVWAFFLIRNGIIGNAIDVMPKRKRVAESPPMPQWSTFPGSALDLSRTLLMPGLVTVFALVFVGEQVRDQVIDPTPPEAGPVSSRIEELGMAINARLDNIGSQIGTGPLQAGLNTQGYTPERAQRLDRTGTGMDRSDEYFARFPIAFEAGTLSDDGAAFVSETDYVAEENSELVPRLVNALIPCGAVDDPVVLRVEGYASSEPFQTRPRA